MNSGFPYAVITALHNEAYHLPRLVAALDTQTTRPSQWVLVENGSSDETPTLAHQFAAEHPYITVVEVDVVASNERGVSIVHALHEGIRALRPFPATVAQVDADISFDSDYFEKLMRLFAADPRLGIISGSCLECRDGRWSERSATVPNVWGAARLYRRECLEQVLPFEPRTGWDAIDVAKANALGWRTATVPAVKFYHHRRESSRESSRWAGWFAQGRVSYYLGYRPTYLLLRACFQAARDPAATALIAGYLSDAFRRRRRYEDQRVRRSVRQTQRLRDLPRRFSEAKGASK